MLLGSTASIVLMGKPSWNDLITLNALHSLGIFFLLFNDVYCHSVSS